MALMDKILDFFISLFDPPTKEELRYERRWKIRMRKMYEKNT